MCAVVQLNYRDYGETIRIAQHEINMFGCDAIECRLPTTTAWIPDWPNNICKSNLGENVVTRWQGLLEDSEKGALGWREQGRDSLVRRSGTLRSRRCAKQASRCRDKCEEEQSEEREKQWCDEFIH